MIPRDASEEQTLVDVMRDVVRSFEGHVRAHPNQWFQFKLRSGIRRDER